MRLYSNPIAELKISGCGQCPHKKAQRYKNGSKFSTGYVCGAITLIHTNALSGIHASAHPSLRDALASGVELEECPLPEVGREL